MAKNTYKSNTFKKPAKKKTPKKVSTSFLKDRRLHLAIGLFLLLGSFYLFIAFVSYMLTGKADQSVVESISETGIVASGSETKNWLGLFGAITSHYFIFRWLGIAAFFIPPILFFTGYKIVFGKTILPISKVLQFSIFSIFWVGLLLGYSIKNSEAINEWNFLSGGLGYEMANVLDNLIGWGTVLLLIFSLLVFVIYFFNATSLFDFNLKFGLPFKKTSKTINANAGDSEKAFDHPQPVDVEEKKELEFTETELDLEPFIPDKPKKDEVEGVLKLDIEDTRDFKEPSPIKESNIKEPDFTITKEEPKEKLADHVENYDPTLDLSSYLYPTVELLNEYSSEGVKVSQEELEQNKEKILETLINFKIGISRIKATIGPTVTLYEIVPEAGIKISKIKNLEDDIALSLAALGIRIIAPIPGKGTIGIEVPNKNREMVSMRSVITTDKFMKSDKELPVVLGKTISNEVYVTDLAKMPHLLMAGATGQGKSVGLNVLLASLIYKKHPSQLKFVLVDPKKVELTLFNKIERHFLAKLPESDEAIITDTKKVIYTLNSLCIEMDNRYNLLKDAACRNLKEYNAKFVERRLNPEKGHRFLPYIVLVIDELSDLMMTSGKEVETPIARLAQLARAVGIHLVVATQRPSVNVITGLIKANFPARLSFRVTSKIDSRTILDTGGAEQLVGQGDMLLSQGSDIIRLQCAFIDTPEVENICDFVGEQRGYDSAYILPEFSGDEGGDSVSEINLAERDTLFEDAARLIVAHQQGSTSLIQRKLKLGYNRAGRLIDQLEAAGIVGPFEGSKARDVLISDEYSLEQLLNEIDKN
ncbi:DNA translocase FtsK [Fulvivirgaceae bacterium BMA10]|uniref:DNA translocase FtsK n=1 Tax=Splendidivirga corallicola TaxID=3051826 RepID=A0ABT8KLL0_9BACT|nr:DNA translocase FtsK [Fulvivirgaceae bacterium BMA10]